MGPRHDERRPWEPADEPGVGAPAAVLMSLVVATVVTVALLGLAVAGRL